MRRTDRPNWTDESNLRSVAVMLLYIFHNMRNIRKVVEKHSKHYIQRIIREFEFLNLWNRNEVSRVCQSAAMDKGVCWREKSGDEGKVHILNLNIFNEFIWNWLRMVNIQYRWGNEVYTGRISCKGEFHHNRLSNWKYPQHNNWTHRWLQCRICPMPWCLLRPLCPVRLIKCQPVIVSYSISEITLLEYVPNPTHTNTLSHKSENKLKTDHCMAYDGHKSNGKWIWITSLMSL